MTKMTGMWMVAALAAAGCADSTSAVEHRVGVACETRQIFANAQHAGEACPEQIGLQIAATITQDPDADQNHDDRGFYQLHASAALVTADTVIVPGKTGYTSNASLFTRTTDQWHVVAYNRADVLGANGGEPLARWKRVSSWRPVDSAVASIGFVTNGYVSLFQPAISDGSLWVPAASGQIERLDLQTGSTQAIINPFAGTKFSGDTRMVVNNAIMVDRDGDIWYTTRQYAPGGITATPPTSAWLVHVDVRTNTARIREWNEVASNSLGIPSTLDMCERDFTDVNPPVVPTSPDTQPPRARCNRQVPALNSAVSQLPSGELIVHSMEYQIGRRGGSWLIKVDRGTMRGVLAMDARNRPEMRYGCGDRLTIVPGQPVGSIGGNCAILTANGTVNLGTDPRSNRPVNWRGQDLVDSHPVVTPDGDSVICSYDSGAIFGGGFDARGSCLVFRSDGSVRAANTIHGWEDTPSVWVRPDGGYSFLQDLQAYSDLQLNVGELDEDMQVLETHTDPSVALTFTDFVDNNIPFGVDGDRYAVNGDGFVRKWRPGSSTPVEILALRLPGETEAHARITLSNPWSRGPDGELYVTYGGIMWVIRGGAVSLAADAPAQATSARLAAGMAAKLEAMRAAADPRRHDLAPAAIAQ